jgi:nickel-dependent lactate racemase
MDAASQFRWSIAWLEDNLTHLHQHENLSQEAGWLVGIHFAIAVVPSLDGHVAEVLAGKPDKVFQQATELLTSVDPNAFDLVIAMVDGKEEQQNWLSVARAASQAESLCKTDGRIVVCCDVKKSTKGIRDLASDSPSEEANRRLLKAHVEDAFPAAVLRSIREQRSLYLFSSMKPNEVESLGFAFIDSVASLQHLMEQASKVCIVRGAQY